MARKGKTWEWRNEVYGSEKELLAAVKVRLREMLAPPVTVRDSEGQALRRVAAKIQLKLTDWPRGERPSGDGIF